MSLSILSMSLSIFHHRKDYQFITDTLMMLDLECQGTCSDLL